MMKTMNQTHIEGLLYEHSLEMKVTGPNSKNPGTNFIAGTVSIATDDECTNIVPVHYMYVTPTWGNTNRANANFGILKDIIDGKYHTVMKDGKDNATKLNIDSAIGLNEFYSDRNGASELVSVKRNESGFIHILSNLNEKEDTHNTFRCDMIITNVRDVDGNVETNEPAKAIVKGYTFDFRNALLPIELVATNAGAMNYFLGLGASEKEPVFTRVWGRQISMTTVRTVTEESAFGDPQVREVKSSRKEFVITGAQPNPYIWDDESSMTVAEFKDALTNRETYLATVKQRQDEYNASKGNAIKPTANNAPANGSFKF